MRLQNLSDVHTRRNAERIQNDLDRSAVRHVRHIFLRHDAGNDAFVAMAAGHLVADGKLALHGDVHLDQLDDARGQLVALLELVLALFGDLAQHVDLARGHFLDFLDLLDEKRILFVEFQALEVASGDFFDDLAGQLDALGQQALVGLLVVQVRLEYLAAKQIGEALQALIREDSDFVGEVLFQLENLRGFDGLVALVFFSALAGKDLDVHNRAFNARRAVQRSVANIAGFFAEDSAQQFFFRRQGSLTFGSHLANKNVSRFHNRADADDSALVEVAEERFADVGNIASDFLRAKLGIARFDFIFLDVDRSVVVVLNQLFADQDGVFEVVTAPGHESHEHVAAKGKFAAFRARTIGKNLTLLYAVADSNKRLLADASVLVRTLEFDELINVRAHFAALQHKVAGLAAINQFGCDLHAIVKRNVGLRDDVLVLFPGGQIEAVRLVNNLAALQLFVEVFDFILFDDFAGLEFAVAGIDDLNVVDDAPALDLAVGRLDEAVVVDAREAAQRADQADVRAFRRFNRANAAVVSWVYVVHLKSSALAREAD